MSYLTDFLFTPQRALTPVKALSGGECNRLLLARLFSKPANLLVMDEPTNDLDIETLELLEELLAQYQGTLLLVSHDRAFVDNVVTSTLVFSGNGQITEFVGGYQDYLRQRPVTQIEAATPKKSHETMAVKENNKATKKLSYKEQRELDELPGKIEKMETDHAALQQLIASPEFYQKQQDDITATMDRLTKLGEDLDKAYQRWATLEALLKS